MQEGYVYFVIPPSLFKYRCTPSQSISVLYFSFSINYYSFLKKAKKKKHNSQIRKRRGNYKNLIHKQKSNLVHWIIITLEEWERMGVCKQFIAARATSLLPFNILFFTNKSKDSHPAGWNIRCYLWDGHQYQYNNKYLIYQIQQ